MEPPTEPPAAPAEPLAASAEPLAAPATETGLVTPPTTGEDDLFAMFAEDSAGDSTGWSVRQFKNVSIRSKVKNGWTVYDLARPPQDTPVVCSYLLYFCLLFTRTAFGGKRALFSLSWPSRNLLAMPLVY